MINFSVILMFHADKRRQKWNQYTSTSHTAVNYYPQFNYTCFSNLVIQMY